jgi:hypothetical protein
MVAGLSLTVFVAWGCARWSDFDSGRSSARDARSAEEMNNCVHDGALSWPVPAPPEWPNPQFGFDGAAVGMEYSSRHSSEIVGPQALQRFNVRLVRAGWPLRALGWQVWEEEFDSAGPKPKHSSRLVPGTSRGYIDMKRWLGPRGTSVYSINEVHQRLPLVPIWPGCVFNSILYGALAWAACRSTLAWRSWRRHIRGRCPSCGYPVGSSATCTECGRSLPAMRRATATQ